MGGNGTRQVRIRCVHTRVTFDEGLRALGENTCSWPTWDARIVARALNLRVETSRGCADEHTSASASDGRFGSLVSTAAVSRFEFHARSRQTPDVLLVLPSGQ
eukprot:1653062-Prymnesium_polylepis.1